MPFLHTIPAIVNTSLFSVFTGSLLEAENRPYTLREICRLAGMTGEVKTAYWSPDEDFKYYFDCEKLFAIYALSEGNSVPIFFGHEASWRGPAVFGVLRNESFCPFRCQLSVEMFCAIVQQKFTLWEGIQELNRHRKAHSPDNVERINQMVDEYFKSAKIQGNA